MTPLRRQIKHVSETKGLTIKQIVNLCECSRSHFYKVLDGQRSPSEALQLKLMEVLELNEAEFASLLNATESAHLVSEQKNNQTLQLDDEETKPSHVFLFKPALIILSLIFTFSIAFYFYSSQSESKPNKSVIKTGFATKFIKDVTIPDGSPIPINSKFTKTWRVQNIGTIAWKEKSLKRMTPQDPNLCYSVDKVTLPTVKSGETIDISVEFTTPRYPGTCRTDWKMVDIHDNLIFPNKQGLYSIVHVVEENL